MFEFYLTIMDSIAKAQEHSFQVKFNKLVYAEEELSSDEKFYLLGEMQKRWNKFADKANKK
ncbi:MAG: hypothetical protein NW226_12230 [Microscillaceae bacterium]|nr:hypothetical protein [Microscillaceae bacterium]